jgi:hypothetical protein
MANAFSAPRCEARRGRAARFVACHRCAVGWAVYLAVAAAIVALYVAG